MKKRVVEKIMAMLLVAGMLGGCGQSDAGTGNNVEEKNVQKNEETENSVLEDSGGKKASATEGEVVELEFLFGDPNRTEIFSRIVEDFNNSQDEVHVTFNATGTNHLEELMTRLATNDVPDITSQLQGYELASYVEAGYIKDISQEPYLEYIRDTELDTVTVDGGVYGIPMDTQAWGVFYNKKLFEQAGIEKIPETVSELKDCVDKLNAAGNGMDNWAVPRLWGFLYPDSKSSGTGGEL